MNSLKATSALICVVIAMTGCENIKNDATRTKTEGTAGGVILGAGIGAGVGALAGGRAGAVAGAAIGAVVGGIAGYSYGSSVAARKHSYAQREGYLNNCIAEAQQTRGRVETMNTNLRTQIASETQELNQLVAQRDKSRTTVTKYSALNERIDKSLDLATAELQRTEKILHAHQTAISDPNNARDLNTKAWATEVTALKSERDQLQANAQALGAMQAKMKTDFAQR